MPRRLGTTAWSLISLGLAGVVVLATADDSIQPYGANPSFWQYQQKPVLLLGG